MINKDNLIDACLDLGLKNLLIDGLNGSPDIEQYIENGNALIYIDDVNDAINEFLHTIRHKKANTYKSRHYSDDKVWTYYKHISSICYGKLIMYGYVTKRGQSTGKYVTSIH